MRNITAYERLVEALDVLSDALARSAVHMNDSDDAERLARVDRMRERLRAVRVDDPDGQVDGITRDAVLAAYEDACRARFFTGSESSYGEFGGASRSAEDRVGSLFASGSESWEKFPP